MSSRAGQPVRQGPMQSPTWSESRSSSAIFREARTSSESVWTTMPSATGMAQEGDRFARPFDLHGAEEAGSRRREILDMAERGDADPQPRAPPRGSWSLPRPEISRPSIVNSSTMIQVSRKHASESVFMTTSIAFSGQAVTHMPQRVQQSSITSCRSYGRASMAPDRAGLRAQRAAGADSISTGNGSAPCTAPPGSAVRGCAPRTPPGNSAAWSAPDSARSAPVRTGCPS